MPRSPLRVGQSVDLAAVEATVWKSVRTAGQRASLEALDQRGKDACASSMVLPPALCQLDSCATSLMSLPLSHQGPPPKAGFPQSGCRVPMPVENVGSSELASGDAKALLQGLASKAPSPAVQGAGRATVAKTALPVPAADVHAMDVAWCAGPLGVMPKAALRLRSPPGTLPKAAATGQRAGLVAFSKQAAVRHTGQVPSQPSAVAPRHCRQSNADAASPSTQEAADLCVHHDLGAVRRQVEFYMSDENLEYDRFFHEKIADSPSGWLPMHLIVGCNRMRAMGATPLAVVQALENSDVEVSAAGNAVRRPKNAGLPVLKARLSNKPKYRLLKVRSKHWKK
eukprot:TRINITY_DN102024_c0_g1_i1.p1 TRINITY_DN102024_c0_g1~~TRINITY_DN102024_c0_g1_i1.p1  ORF type:complete len:365 (+),score=62.35 TRINITY_DN102024_c0_g1_i1:76-1095(+)